MGERADTNKSSLLHSNNVTRLTVAELLQKRRKELDLSIKEVEVATKIRKSYLQYIEAGDYEHLPDNVYTLGYVKSYADYLGFETTPVVNMYKKERLAYKQSRAIGDVLPEDNHMSLKPIGKQKFVLSSKSLFLLASVSLFLLIMLYLGWQVAALAAPPRIALNNNPDKVSTNFIVISGQTDGDADVYIDGSQILTNPDGSFSERVALANGSNQIQVQAKNRLGKTTTVTKSINADIKESSSNNQSVSNTPVNGVELKVTIQNQATWIAVSSDGQDAFRGIMLPGTSQVFKANDSIRLTTGNAGNTQLSITNTTTANQDLGILGKQSETKSNIEFSKDTQIK